MNANRRCQFHRAAHPQLVAVEAAGSMLVFMNLLALATRLAAYLYAQETAVTGAFAGWGIPGA